VTWRDLHFPCLGVTCDGPTIAFPSFVVVFILYTCSKSRLSRIRIWTCPAAAAGSGAFPGGGGAVVSCIARVVSSLVVGIGVVGECLVEDEKSSPKTEMK
jgi:hypothetical protein